MCFSQPQSLRAFTHFTALFHPVHNITGPLWYPLAFTPSMLRRLPPGVRFILPALPKISTPSFVVAIAVRLFDPSPSLWRALFGCVVIYPFIAIVYVQSLQYNKTRKARKLGVDLPATVPYKMFGAVDVLGEMKDAFKNRYPGGALSNCFSARQG